VPIARAVAELAGLRIAMIGGPSPGELSRNAEELDAERMDDLRGLIGAAGSETADPTRLLWILSSRGFGSDTSESDARAVSAARARDVKIATLEPIPASALDLASSGWSRAHHGTAPVDAIRLVPLARFSPAFREAAEPLTHFDRIRTLSVEALCHPSEGSLGARLYSAMELVHAIMGEPELIEAGYSWHGHAASMHVLPGETLRGLEGELSANLRFSDGRIATLLCSDRAGAWSRRALVLGSAGRLTITDDRLEWLDPAGARIESTELLGGEPAGREAPCADALIEPARAPAVRALADALGRLVQPGVPAEPPTDAGAVLAMGQAALLSARTGQGESPATIRRITGTAG